MSAPVLAFRNRTQTRPVGRDERDLLNCYRRLDQRRRDWLLGFAQFQRRRADRDRRRAAKNIAKPVIDIGAGGEGA